MEGIEFIHVEVPWRTILSLRVDNSLLRKSMEGFLDFFERAQFEYHLMDPFLREIVLHKLSGQELLQRMHETLDIYTKSGFTSYLAAQGVRFDKGRFILSDHNRPFNGKAQNGSNTKFVMLPFGPNSEFMGFPVSKEIGRDYLRGASYLGVDGQYYPVTVDQVVVHELAHAAYRDRGEQAPTDIEGIVITPMGAIQRILSPEVKYNSGANGKFRTLYDKLPIRPHGMSITPPVGPSGRR